MNIFLTCTLATISHYCAIPQNLIIIPLMFVLNINNQSLKLRQNLIALTECNYSGILVWARWALRILIFTQNFQLSLKKTRFQLARSLEYSCSYIPINNLIYISETLSYSYLQISLPRGIDALYFIKYKKYSFHFSNSSVYRYTDRMCMQ